MTERKCADCGADTQSKSPHCPPCLKEYRAAYNRAWRERRKSRFTPEQWRAIWKAKRDRRTPEQLATFRDYQRRRRAALSTRPTSLVCVDCPTVFEVPSIGKISQRCRPCRVIRNRVLVAAGKLRRAATRAAPMQEAA